MKCPRIFIGSKRCAAATAKWECESNTANMRLGFAEIIEFVSNFWTWNRGCHHDGHASGRSFRPGDIIEAEIEGIGVLRNPVKGLKVNPRFAREVQLKDIV